MQNRVDTWIVESNGGHVRKSLTVTILILTLLSLPAWTDGASSPESTLETFITVQPTSKDENQLLVRPSPETYTCKAEIAVPGPTPFATEITMYVAPDKPEAKKVERDGVVVEFRASITREADRAITGVTVMVDGVITRRQTSTTWLPKERKGGQ